MHGLPLRNGREHRTKSTFARQVLIPLTGAVGLAFAVALGAAELLDSQVRFNDKPMPRALTIPEEAPDFTLLSAADARQVRLSDFRSKKPVVLLFGSYS